MAVFSRIYFTQLERAKRIDGEYYQPKYLSLVELHKRGQWLPIRKYLELCEYGISIKMNENGEGYKIFRMDDLKNGFAFDNEMKFAPIDSDTFEKFRLKPDDILFNRVNSEEFVGRTGIFKLTGDYVFASYLVRLRTNSGMSPDALNLFLNCKYGILSIRRLSRRAVNQANVNAQELQSILMLRFSSTFQESLTRDSNRSWTLYAESERLYKQAEHLLLSELGLQDWKPTRALTFVRSYSQVAKAGRMDAEYFHPKFQEMLDRIPSQVRFDRLGRLTTYTKGVEVGREAYTDSGIPFWRVSNLSKHGLDDSNANFIGQELYEFLRPNYEPQQGEILLSKDATPGLAYYLERPIQGIISSGILRLAITDTIPPHYLELILNSLFVQMQIEQDAGGSIIKHWKPSEIRKTIIPRLSDDKEKEIAQLVENSHAARREAKALLEKAKRAVEIAIEENEERAMAFIG